MKIRIVANAHVWGGGEMSTATIARMLIARGHAVELNPTLNNVCDGIRAVEGLTIGPKFDELQDAGCDVLLFYANTAIYRINDLRHQWQRVCSAAGRRVMCLNFVIGGAGAPWFRDMWDLVLFLNSTLASQYPANGTAVDVLPPCVDLEPFLSIEPDYSRLALIRLARSKHCESEILIAWQVAKELPDVAQYYMSAPPALLNGHKFPQVFAYDAFQISTVRFLPNGSLFWYRLPARMRDQGPRVIVEAMAAGLPCLVDDRDGARDRVTDDTGWKCDTSADYLDVIRRCYREPALLEDKGQCARQRAIAEFAPEKWMERILG